MRASAYQPGPMGLFEPPQFGLDEVTCIYFSRYNVKLFFEMTCPFGPCRSETVTFTLLRPLDAPFATIWKDSYSPRAAEMRASGLLPAGSVMPTRFKLGAVQTTGLV